MRDSVAAVVKINRDRFLKTSPKRPAIHGFVRGIPVMVGSEGGPGGFGILANTWEELNDIHVEMKQMNDELKSQIPSDSFFIKDGLPIINQNFINNDKVKFFVITWLPTATQWNAYYDSQWSFINSLIRAGSIYINTGVWDTLQGYRKRLVAIRSKAIENGFSFVGPEPTAPKENIIQSAASALKAPVGEIWRVVKIILYAGLVIIGIIVLKGFWIGKSASGGPMGAVG